VTVDPTLTELAERHASTTGRRIEEFLATSGIERRSDESLADEVIRLISTSLAHRQLPSVRAFITGGTVREIGRPAPDLDPSLISVEMVDGNVCRIRSLKGGSLEEGEGAQVVVHTSEEEQVERGDDSDG